MNIDFVPALIFVLVMTFTPGPGNVTSAAMGMLYGYKRAFGFLMGLAAGYLVLMLFCAFVSNELLAVMPSAEPFLRAFGVCYLLWLTVGTARATYACGQSGQKPMAFKHGFLLQTTNPKGIVFGLTLYTTFLSSLSGLPGVLTVSAGVLTAITFCSVSVWALLGTGIGRFLHVPRVRGIVNFVLVVLLVYCAVSLSGVFDLYA